MYVLSLRRILVRDFFVVGVWIMCRRMVGRWMNAEGFERKLSRPIRLIAPSIFIYGLNKMTETSECSGRDSSRVPPEYNSTALPLD
jgi:hypothetical protein